MRMMVATWCAALAHRSLRLASHRYSIGSACAPGACTHLHTCPHESLPSQTWREHLRHLQVEAQLQAVHKPLPQRHPRLAGQPGAVRPEELAVPEEGLVDGDKEQHDGQRDLHPTLVRRLCGAGEQRGWVADKQRVAWASACYEEALSLAPPAREPRPLNFSSTPSCSALSSTSDFLYLGMLSARLAQACGGRSLAD